MKLEKFKEKNHKKTVTIVFTIVCILLVSGVILYRTYAIFEVRTNQNVINGNVQDPGNIYFAFYVDDKIEKMMPQKDEGYIFDEENSYCGVLGDKDTSISLEFDKDKWNVTVSGLKESRTKCNLKFVKGAYILGKPVKAVTSSDGLYEVPHGEEVSGTLNDKGFQQTEWRYAGSNPNNYIMFNNEKWRIIGLVNVMIDEDNTIEQRVKIVRNESIGNFSWDYKKSGIGSSKSDYGSNNWTDSHLMELLNGIYYDSSTGDCWKNLNTGGNASQTTCNFDGMDSSDGNGLKNVQKMIDQNIIWNVGGSLSYSDLLSQWYEKERGTTANDIPSKWYNQNTKDSAGNLKTTLFHSIGLMYISDYGYGTSGGLIGRTKCFSNKLWSWDNTENEQCVINNWVSKNTAFWSMTADIENSYYIYVGNFSGGMTRGRADYAEPIYPTLYLDPKVKIINDGKDGSEGNPYNLKLE